jgi:signal transduction histidine kinase
MVPRPPSFFTHVALGLLAGAAYATLNTFVDALDRGHRVIAHLVALHAFVDRGIPLLAGAALGVSVFFWRSRSERADDLARRLRRAERDQAIWVVATATLHEVRNPLHALGLALDEVGTLGPEEHALRERLLGRARVQMDRIAESFRPLRSLAEAAGPAPERLALDQVVHEVADPLTVLSRREGVQLVVDVDAQLAVRGDPQHLRIVLENLLGNSLEALRGRGGRITVRVARDGEAATVRVTDDGPGIDPSIRAHLFDPLASTKEHGLGLGLSIARALARAMRGDLTLCPGEGTTFELRIPLEEASREAA